MSSSGDSRDDTLPDDSPAPGRASRPSLPGYDLGEVIGEGGMGEVVLARDPRLGRDVAIKRMRAAAPSAELVERFLREAKIQARLDHPAIVPVFDLGRDADGHPYFAMKRLAGKTMFALLQDPSVPRNRLLRAFVEVCLAVDLAHEKGVVHRDLKPANIMLGDYGEVYVLDWGVARILSDVDGVPAAAGSPSVSPDTRTQAGALLGTPGYMAPEQAQGSDVGPPADVYALGCILFEILAGEPRHPRGMDAIESTLSSVDEVPSQRRRDRAIPPELDEACRLALATNREARATARELGDRVQRYLDGDRDLERRRQLAEEQLTKAREALLDPARRAEAFRHAGRALALDPSAGTAELVGRLMIEPPETLPPSLERHLAQIEASSSLTSASVAAKSLIVPFAFMPLLVWAGVKNWLALGTLFALFAVLAVHATMEVRRGHTQGLVALVLGSVLCALIGVTISPFILVPLLIASMATRLGGQPELIGRPRLVMGAMLGAFLLPILGQLLGIVPESWAVAGDRLVVTSPYLHLVEPATTVFLVGMHVLAIVALTTIIRKVTVSRNVARRDLEIQAWQLRQLLPASGEVESP